MGRFRFSMITSTVFKMKITCYISSERLYFSLSNGIKHIIIIYKAYKLCLKNSFFQFYFLKTNISVTVAGTVWIFKRCL